MSLSLLPEFGPWMICAIAVFIGTLVQRLSGAGYGMLAAPMMALVAPEWLPGTIVLVGFFIGAGSMLNARDAVQWKDLPPGFAGRILGAGIAAYIAAAVVGTDLLSIIVGFIVLFAVALNLIGLNISITRKSLFIAGGIGGIMGTLTGIGAPPMAILYSNVETRRSAATQNAFYSFGSLTAIAALGIGGVLTLSQLAFAASLAPLVPLALWISRPLAIRFERGAIRPWALGMATISALILLSHSL
ncbi:TSUP family transporter [Pseudemcibacter aquimaris]|uniref:TSUP family transporter n=1 Tax=Pseudemcibacter aquimaris TaxID=2857064 RepID=UPI002012582E|nr:TSUP family transporter [Pseudemcibacter aquimaris]MCC3859939.1 TSUP family transporter [Pseudemcibacter aquimaris]WDU57271.1 TSUP family transporter [Pseudemcibacter aquimaris]